MPSILRGGFEELYWKCALPVMWPSVRTVECLCIALLGHGPRYIPTVPGGDVNMFENMSAYCLTDFTSAVSWLAWMFFSFFRRLRVARDLWLVFKRFSLHFFCVFEAAQMPVSQRICGFQRGV